LNCLDLANGGNESLPENVEAFEAHLLKTMKDIAENAKEMSVSKPQITVLMHVYCLHVYT
jgi:hypothetical protein